MNTQQIKGFRSGRRSAPAFSGVAFRFVWLFWALLLCAGTFVRAQENVTITMDVKNIPLQEVLKDMEKQSHYHFLYNKTLIDVSRKVTLRVTRQPVRKVLDKLFAGSGVEYTFRNRQIILSLRQPKENNTPEITPATSSSSGGHTITGRVTDPHGEPLIGVNIKVEGTTTGMVTDANGKFSLKVKNGDVLFVSYMGFRTMKITVKGDRRDYSINMQEDSEVLEDIIIVGYGVQKKASITGAITNISGDALKVNSTINTSSALAGTIAGINSRMTDGRPGATTKISIRGMDTPLYIIDGVQRDESQFNNIDANDIESISILKDASAAIYGLRAANGVVVVKTKSGNFNSRHTVNIKALYGWQDFFRFPEPASAASYVRAQYQSDVVQKASNPNYTSTYTREEYQKWQAGTERGYEGFNWFDFATDPGAQSYIGANITGGSDKVGYYIALSNTTQDYAIRDFGGFNRTNLQINVNAKLSEKFSFNASVSGRLQNLKAPGLGGGDEIGWMLFGAYRNLPTMRPYVNDNPLYPAKTSSYIYTNFAVTTLGKNGEDLRKERAVQFNIDATYKFTDYLSLKLIGGYALQYWGRSKQVKTFDLYEYDAVTGEYYVTDGQKEPSLYKYVRNTEDYTGQFTLDFQKQFGRHNVSATVGGEASRFQTPNNPSGDASPGIELTSQPQTDLTTQITTSTLQAVNDMLYAPKTRAGFIGRFTYDYDGRYLLEFLGRYDGSWKFPATKRWGFFPSVSAGWRITEESWWTEDMKRYLSNLKLKVSYGVVGDENTSGYSPYDYLEGYNYNSGGAVLDGKWVIGSQYRGLPVTQLSWQKVKMFNVGFEYGFFDNRLTGELNYFSRTLEGIPAGQGINLPTEAGLSLPKVNKESQKIRGLDGSVKWTDKVRDFNYSVEGNFTLARKYEWERSPWKFSHSWEKYQNWYEKRYSSQWWGLECTGQFQDWEQIASYPVDIDGKGNTTLRPGDLIYKDTNNDGVINNMDKRPMGYRQGDVPCLSFNFNIAMSWKGFDLAVLFTGAALASFYMDMEMKNPLHDGGNSPAFMLDDMWHLSDINDPNSTYLPGKYPMVLAGNGNHSNYASDRLSTFWLRNVRYLKMRNFELGYTLPKRLVRKVNIENLRVFTSIQNLFSIDNVGDIGIDPEIATQSGQQYPTTKVFSFGLNLTF